MKTTLLSTVLLLGCMVLSSHTISWKEHNASVVAGAYTTTRKAAAMPSGPVSIVIDKSDYELHVYDAKGWYATYPVVFGNNPLADKKMEGDKLTPEGRFKIVAKRPHAKWSRFLALDYPTQEHLARFEERKRRGEVPGNASPGGGIGIHGTWPHDDFMIDRFKNWTNGCIALKNSDVQELYGYIQVGTPVTIRK
jgi:murein L,D-transpeptidase YafK